MTTRSDRGRSGNGKGLVACGALLALTACTGTNHDTAPPPSAHTWRATAAPKPTTSSPAHTVSTVPLPGTAQLRPQDANLLAWLAKTDLPSGGVRPTQDSIVVIHRSPNGRTGTIGWIGDGHFCLGIMGAPHSTLTCGPLETPADPTQDATAGSLPWTSAGTDDTDITLAVVLDDAGPYRFTNDDHLGVIHQARARLGADRQVTFLEWSYTSEKLPPTPKLCSTSTPNCVPAKP